MESPQASFGILPSGSMSRLISARGNNNLRIVVGNTAINAMAGQPSPDYRLLWDRYGMLFVPQDMQNLEPVPSGILGPGHAR